MPRTSSFDRQALAALGRKQLGVITPGQALDCGMPLHLVKYRIRQGGPWQVLVRGVYLTHSGTPTDDQRDMAALLYGGPHSVLTASAALRRHGLQAPRTGMVDVLVPVAVQKGNAGFVRTHRTVRLPSLFCVSGEIRYALPPRAVADAVRGLAAITDVRAVVADAVQRGMCPLPRLAEELSSGSLRGSARLRQALAEVAEGVRSTAEADLRDLIVQSRLPTPMFNPRLFVGRAFLGIPDCWWPQSGVAAEVDSRAWHLSPDDWERTLARHTRMSAHGIIVLHFTPGQIRTRGMDVITVISDALAAARDRPLPQIRALPSRG